MYHLLIDVIWSVRERERAPFVTYLVIVIGRDSLNEGCFASFIDPLSILLSELSDSCLLKHEGLVYFCISSVFTFDKKNTRKDEILNSSNWN